MISRAAILVAAFLISCSAARDVDLARYCGGTLLVGASVGNGNIRLPLGNKGDAPVYMPDDCEIELRASNGYAVYLQFLAIDLPSCDQRIQVSSKQPGIPEENVFDSSPYFCGRSIVSDSPITLTYNDASTVYKIQFNKGSKTDWVRSSCLFQFSSKIIGNKEELVWPTDTSTALSHEDPFTSAPTAASEEVAPLSTTSYLDEVPASNSDLDQTTWTDSDKLKTTWTDSEELKKTWTDSDKLQTTWTDSDELKTTWTDSDELKTTWTSAILNTGGDMTTTMEASTSSSLPSTLQVENATSKTPEMSSESSNTNGGTFDCYCSVDFEKAGGSHRLLQDSSNLIRKVSHSIDIPPGPPACQAAQQRCNFFCKLNDQICSLSGDIGPSQKVNAQLMSSINCPSKYNSIVSNLGQLCCKRGMQVDCDSYYPPTTKPPVIKCTCQPLYVDGPKHKLLPAVYKVYLPYTGRCVDVENECARRCHDYVSDDSNIKWKIADGACRDMKIYLGKSLEDQSLEFLSSIQPSSLCTKPSTGLIANSVVSRDFCCSGGSKTMYTNCSSLSKPTLSPTSNWFTTPFKRSTYSCKCSPRYYNYMRGSSLIKVFPAIFTTTVDAGRGCATANSLCRQQCSRISQKGSAWFPGALGTSFNQRIANDMCSQLYPQQPMDFSRLQLYSTLETSKCAQTQRESFVRTLSHNYCCHKGQSVSCSGRQPKPTTPSPTVSNGFRCQCKPLYYNNTAGLESERIFPPVYETTVSYNYGCSQDSAVCTQICRKYLSQSSAASRESLTKKIATSVCHQIFTPFKVKQPYQSFLEMYSVVDSARCPSSAKTYVKTISQSFCCSGAAGSSSNYVQCQSMEQQDGGSTQRPYDTTRMLYDTTRRPYDTTRRPYDTTRSPYDTTRMPYDTTRRPYDTTSRPYYTTRRPYYTTRRPYYTTHGPYYTTRRPSTYVSFSCECAMRLRYHSNGHTFKTVHMDDLVSTFPSPQYTWSSNNCTSFRSVCRNRCQTDSDPYMRNGAIIKTPYGYKNTDDAVCHSLGRGQRVPFDFSLRSTAVAAGCSTIYTTGKTYNRNICCGYSGSTLRKVACRTNSAVG